MSTDPTDDPRPYRDPVGLHGAHLLTCHHIWNDPERSGAGFGLGGVYTHFDLPDGQTFPILAEQMWVYFQLWGDVGEYRLRTRLVRIRTTEDDEEEEVQLGPDGEPREFPMPPRRPVLVSGLNYMEEAAYLIGPVPFREAGLYEYQLWADGFDTPIARERVMAREWKHDE
jgi:hypothetical protein